MWRSISVLTVAIAISLAGAARGAKASKSGRARDMLAGTIDKVDIGAGKLIVQPKAGKKGTKGQPVQITVDENTVIKLEGTVVALKELREGMAVKVTPSTGTAEKIEAKQKPPKEKQNDKRKGGKSGD